MNGLTEWTRDLLMSRGALLEADAGVLRALLPTEVGGALGCGEWLSLDFEASAGADDAGEWLDRLAALLPSSSPVIAARMRDRSAVIGFDAQGVLDRELIVQNGVYRLVDDYSTLAQYFLCTFQYAVESDERSIGFFTVGVNASANSLIPHPETLLRSLQERQCGVGRIHLRARVLRLIVRPLVGQLRLQDDLFGVEAMAHQRDDRQTCGKDSHRETDSSAYPAAALL